MTRTDAHGSEPFTHHLGDALDRLDNEQGVLAAEVDAFRDFRRRLRAMDADAAAATTTTAAAADDQSGSTAASAGLAVDRAAGSPPENPIRAAYEETVMATPHYDDEYGDAYAESVTAEFGPALAAALSAPRRLTEPVKQQAVAAAGDARTRRERLRSALDGERDAVTEARTALDAVAAELVAVRSRPFYACDPDELDRLAADLDDLDARCGSLARRRQTGDLEPPAASLSASDAALPEYLYQSLPVTHPVLDAVAAAAEAVAVTRRRVQRVRAALDAAAE